MIINLIVGFTLNYRMPWISSYSRWAYNDLPKNRTVVVSTSTVPTTTTTWRDDLMQNDLVENVTEAARAVTESVVEAVSEIVGAVSEGTVSTTTGPTSTIAESVTEATTKVVETTSEGITTSFVSVTDFMPDMMEAQDQAKAVQEEIMKKVNEVVEKLNNASRVREEEKGPLFGEVEKSLERTIESVSNNIKNASFGEILVLVIGILTILYYLDKFVKWGFRQAIRKNYEGLYYQPGDEDNSRRRWRMFWRGMEAVLERVWIPLWCSGSSIRRETLTRLVDDDLESVTGCRPPNNTRVETPRERGPAVPNRQILSPASRSTTIFQLEQEPQLIRTHRMISRTPQNKDKEEEERR